jgi:putative pyruvate formate lyase activating enzyme
MNTPAIDNRMCAAVDRVESLLERLTDCNLCPRNCHVNRTAGETGICGMDDQIRISTANLHHGEEPPLSGTRGSGTIFMTGCNLQCVYCQNYPISQLRHGRAITSDGLMNTMLELQKRGAHNINFVTPTHFSAQIVAAIYKAKSRGLTIPIVWNSSGYDRLDVLMALDGLVEIYLPDMRYSDPANSRCYSKAGDYPEVNRAAVIEMHRQVGVLQTDREGIAQRGLIIRHLVLPENISGTRSILKFIAEQLTVLTHISLMSQYFPAHKAHRYAPVSRRINADEYRQAVGWMEEFGLENGWYQHEAI